MCEAAPDVCAFWSREIDPLAVNKRISGGVYLYPTQARRVYTLLDELLRSHRRLHVCETGFNMGHFASMVLLLNRTRVTSFDLMKHPHQLRAAARLRNVFGHDRFQIIEGNTRSTVPAAAMPPCHLVHISVPGNEARDLVNLYPHSFEGTHVTATGLHPALGLYRRIFPEAQRLGILNKVRCEAVEAVPLSRKLYMSTSERSQQMHCWGRYKRNFALSRTVYEFAHRVLASRSGRGAVVSTGSQLGGVLFEEVAHQYAHRMMSPSDLRVTPWVLLWVHHDIYPQRAPFCRMYRAMEQSATITYILTQVHSVDTLECLFEHNMRVYTLLGASGAPPNSQVTRQSNVSRGTYVFATHGNDLAIPDEFAVYRDHRSLARPPVCIGPSIAVPKLRRRRLPSPVMREGHNRSIVVVLVDALSNIQLLRRFPLTINALRNRQLTAVPSYTAVGDHSGPNQAALYETDGTWLWDELTSLGYATLKLENTCSRHSALMKTRRPQTTHGVEFDEFFCKSKTMHDCIGNTTSLEVMFDVAHQFMRAYDNESSAVFVHVENMHEETMTHSVYTDALLAGFLQNLPSGRAVTVLSDHGLHYGAYSQTPHGVRELWRPFAYHNFPRRDGLIMSTPHHVRHAMRSYLGLHIPEQDPLRSVALPPFDSRVLGDDKLPARPCRAVVPSIFSYFADTNAGASLRCRSARAPFRHHHPSGIYFGQRVMCRTAMQPWLMRSHLNFTNDDRYVVVNSRLWSLPAVPPPVAHEWTVVFLEVDSLSRMMARHFFPRLRHALSTLDTATNREYLNFNVVGDNSVPNQAALLSRCRHSYADKTSVVGRVFDCDHNLFTLLKRSHGFKTFFGEEFCEGTWSVSHVLNLSSVDHLHDSSYCHLSKTGTSKYDLCLSGHISSKWPLSQVDHFLTAHADNPTFAFASLVPLHYITKRRCKSYKCIVDDTRVLNTLDRLLASWVSSVVERLLAQSRPFVEIVKGDHGVRDDVLARRRYADRVEHSNPFLHVLAQGVDIATTATTLTTPFDLYDMVTNIVERSPSVYEWSERTCEEAGIPRIHCACPRL